MKVEFLSVLILIACTSAEKREAQLLKEASSIHNAMVKDAYELKITLNKLKDDSLSTIPSDSIHVLLNLIEAWESELVEVPGNGEHHHVGSHHDHTPPPVTAGEMLSIQKELKKQFESITERFSALKPSLP